MLPSQYYTKRFSVEPNGQIIHFAFNLPTHLRVCTGILVHPSAIPDVHYQGAELVGFAALELNNKRFLSNFPALIDIEGCINDYYFVDVELETPLVTGYYRDQQLLWRPYDVTIYFKCQAKETTL